MTFVVFVVNFRRHLSTTLDRGTTNSFKLKILLKDNGSLRLNEQYRGDNLEKYAYYWLDAQDNLIIGWDNAPHHLHLSSHPHHKHIAKQTDVHPSTETDLDAVLDVIRGELSADR